MPKPITLEVDPHDIERALDDAEGHCDYWCIPDDHIKRVRAALEEMRERLRA